MYTIGKGANSFDNSMYMMSTELKKNDVLTCYDIFIFLLLLSFYSYLYLYDFLHYLLNFLFS